LEILNADSFNKAYKEDPNSILTILFVKKTEYYCPQNWLSYKCTGESFSISFSTPLVRSTRKDPSTLSAFLKRYKDVFDPVEAAKLADQKGFEHAIKTTSPLLFGPLYNLLGPQLKALRDYIKDALKKG
jgi:hypothetical protein